MGGNGDAMLGGKGGENLGSILDRAVHIAASTPSLPPPPRVLERKEGRKRIINQIIIFPYATIPPLLM